MPITQLIEKPYIDEISFMGQDEVKRTIITNLYFISQVFRKLKKGYSPTIGICGNQRVGKSFIALWICHTMCCLFGKKFDVENNTFYEPIKAIKDLEHKSREPLLIDEASDVLDVREWYEQTHQALKSIINTQAYKTMLYIFISPFIADIDKSFTKHFDFLIRVDDRGRYKTFRFVKRYDEINIKKVVYRRFLDDCTITMKEVPTVLWDRYINFSIKEKEKIRKKRLGRLTKKEDKFDDPIRRLRTLLKGAK